MKMKVGVTINRPENEGGKPKEKTPTLKLKTKPEEPILEDPVDDSAEDLEEKLRQFEKLGEDEVTELARSQEGPDTVHSTETEDPVYAFLEKVMKGEISEKELKEKAKKKCTKCYGRGYEGHQIIGDDKIPFTCRCVLKEVKKDTGKKDEKN